MANKPIAVADVRGDLAETHNLIALPKRSAPSLKVRIIAFISVLVGGVLGGFVGYAVAGILSDSEIWKAIGIVSGSVFSSIGIGIIMAITLQAMIEWRKTTIS